MPTAYDLSRMLLPANGVSVNYERHLIKDGKDNFHNLISGIEKRLDQLRTLYFGDNLPGCGEQLLLYARLFAWETRTLSDWLGKRRDEKTMTVVGVVSLSALFTRDGGFIRIKLPSSLPL